MLAHQLLQAVFAHIVAGKAARLALFAHVLLAEVVRALKLARADVVRDLLDAVLLDGHHKVVGGQGVDRASASAHREAAHHVYHQHADKHD